MDLKLVEKIIRKVKPPGWVHGWSVVAASNPDGDPMYRVFLDIDEHQGISAVYDELQRFENSVREELWATGAEQWVHFKFRTPYSRELAKQL